MRLISWNCNMAFRKKYEQLHKLKGDLLVIQECENKEKICLACPDLNPDQFLWLGDNKHKGIGLISFQDYTISLSDRYNPEFRYIVPYQCKISGKDINLFVIWAMPHKVKSRSYVGQVWKAIQYYEKELASDSILIGDFNSHVRWDKERQTGNHSSVVDYLKQRHIISVYHKTNNCQSGEEKDPTFYMYKNETKPYHIDYCFASESLVKKCKMTVGLYEDWISLSDHMPLSIDLLF